VPKIRGRHALLGIGVRDAREELAALGTAGSDDRAAISKGEEPLLAIKTELGLALVRIRPVTLEAVVREDGSDVTIEGHRHVARGSGQEGQQQ
jgi:hypothetical protein